MTVTRLRPKYVEKVWGRRALPAGFESPPAGREPIGEVWFEHPDRPDMALLVKYLFTSERLSIQVHPDDAAARAVGERQGKDEAWQVMWAEPDAVIGLGLRERVSPTELRAATLDGSIEALVDWRPIESGEFLYAPAGTIHAIGAGLILIEIQQSCDVTYRLYDYGRPRPLHVDQAIACARLEPYTPAAEPRDIAPGRSVSVAGPAFVIERWTYPLSGSLRADRPIWIAPLVNSGRLGTQTLNAATILLVEGSEPLALDENADLLAVYPGSEVADGLFEQS